MAPTLGSNWQQYLVELPGNWDSYGSREITCAAIEAVASFSVVPLHGGGVQVEFHRDGFDVEIEVRPDGTIEDVLVERAALKEGK